MPYTSEALIKFHDMVLTPALSFVLIPVDLSCRVASQLAHPAPLPIVSAI